MSYTHSAYGIALTAALAIPTLAGAQARQFVVRNDGGSRIQFVSDAPLETITGVSSAVRGELTVDPAALAGTTGRVQVPVASLRSGVDMRDEHLRSASWLDAARFPQATFELTAVEGATALTPNQRATVRVRGRFTIHGVTRPIVAQAQVRFVPLTPEMRATPGIDGDVLRIRATFSVRLTQFGVSVPAIVRLKVAEEIQVNVDLRAIAARRPS